MLDKGRAPDPPAADPVIRLGPEKPLFPVILSVPHAGRLYPARLLHDARIGEERLRALEDRHVDMLVTPLAESGFTVIVGNVARAWIDLNRSEREIDPEMIIPQPARAGLEASAKVRGGLGLVPRRLARHGNIYRQPIAAADLANRIATAYRPYHATLSDALDAARRLFGVAILLDCHSMPPLRPKSGQAPAEIVIGDRDGQSAAPAFAARISLHCRKQGFRTARNAPYAGGHILARHGRPERDIHALQLEICRSLYLDQALDKPAPGAARMITLVEAVAQGLSEEALSPPDALAAE
ncbi:N-formylglutamate amidohydrolase [Parasphingopyxis marina]|uniref:N-formylglutamate amidohydrolase n=1 Tax=Parasphingopyxis marina TaxID=2761622 RepID=A0A842I0T2_9SPHN|nr:N-formylglutamate amidohydrolase [Parasphingopyxis marina]MBC2778259.1 N-formylglutamate amidohydrolase [Parasphingopyxis marina]